MDRTLAHLRKIVLPDSNGSPPNTHNMGLVRCLLGLDEPRWTDEVRAQIAESSEAGETNNQIKWFGTALNESQKEAIRFCLKAENVACIHGPPGVSRPRWVLS